MGDRSRNTAHKNRNAAHKSPRCSSASALAWAFVTDSRNAQVDVIVQLEGDFAARWRTGEDASPEAARLQAVLASGDASLQAQHPGVADRELSRWFVAHPRDDDEGALLVAALIALPCVDAAYIKPTAELPF